MRDISYPSAAPENDRGSGSLADRAYAALRQSIVTLRLPPGSLIQEEAISKELQIGRTPIREALIRLQQDDLVNVLPRRGTFVSKINITDLAQISEIRAEMEGFAALLAARRASAVERSEAGVLCGELDLLEQDHGHDRLIGHDQRVHYFVYRCTRNALLEQSLVRYYTLSLRIWYLVLDRVARLPAAVQEHQALLQAIQHGDGAGARRIAAGHVKGFEAEIRKVI